MGLGVGDEFGNGGGGKRRTHLHDQRAAADERDRRNVAHKIEIEILVDRGVDRVGDAGEKQRVAVRRRVHHRVGGDAARRARTILDHEGLAEPVRKALRKKPRENVAEATGAVADEQADRPHRVIGRQCGAWQRRNGKRARCQVQKSAASKIHVESVQKAASVPAAGIA
jgi:hypothetical protein